MGDDFGFGCIGRKAVQDGGDPSQCCPNWESRLLGGGCSNACRVIINSRRVVGLCKDFRFFVGLCKSFRLKSAGGLEYNICQRQAMHTPAIHKTYHNRAKTARIGSYAPPPSLLDGACRARFCAGRRHSRDNKRTTARWASPPCCCTLAVTAPISPTDFTN